MMYWPIGVGFYGNNIGQQKKRNKENNAGK